MAILDRFPPLNTVNFLVLTVLTPLAYFLCLTIYRLFFSPLAKLPGPWLTKISSIPEANALKQARRAAWVVELFEQNPDAVAVRTGPSSVSFNDPEAIKTIYGTLTLPLPSIDHLRRLTIGGIQATAKPPTSSANRAGTTPSPQQASRSSPRAPRNSTR